MKKGEVKKELLFGKKNYKFLIIALSIIIFGFVMMTGGGSEDPKVFNPDIFSFRRIRLAPTIILLGFVIAIYSIIVKSNKN